MDAKERGKSDLSHGEYQFQRPEQSVDEHVFRKRHHADCSVRDRRSNRLSEKGTFGCTQTLGSDLLNVDVPVERIPR